MLLHKMCFKFLYNFCLKYFPILRRNKRDMIKMQSFFIKSAFYSYPILMELEFSQHNFEKSSNIKLHENPSSGSRVIPY